MKLFENLDQEPAKPAKRRSKVAKMCFWFKPVRSIETSLDQRFGSTTITAPTSGAYTGHVAPPKTAFVGSAQQTPFESPSPPRQEHVQVAEPSEAVHSALRIIEPSLLSASPAPTQPSFSPNRKSQSLPNNRPLSTSTQLSHYDSSSSSPQHSPDLYITSDPVSTFPTAQNRHSTQSPLCYSSAPSHPRSQNAIVVLYSSAGPSSTPLPVHQAYIPNDQLTMGSKVARSPGLQTSSTSTLTAGGSRTGQFFSSVGGASRDGNTAVSPIDGRNLWKRERVRNGAGLVKGLGVIFGKGTARQTEEEERKKADAEEKRVTPLWGTKEIHVVPVVAAGQPQEPQLKISAPLEADATAKPTADMREKKRASRIQLPHITLGNVPKPRRGQPAPKTPMSPSPIEQWPGCY